MSDFEVHPIGTADRLEKLEAALAFIGPALPVLRSLLARIGLKAGVEQADRMIAGLPSPEAPLRTKS